MRERVAITGIGILSALGRGKAPTIDALREGRSGIRRITSIDASPLACQIAGEVPAEDAATAHKGDRFTRFALIAAEEAAEQAGYAAGAFDSERVSVIVGTGLGGCESTDAAYRRVYGEGQARVAPASIPHAMYNAATSAVSSRFDARGMAYGVVSACASSAHAIGLAAQQIRSGQADVVFAGGADAPLVTGIIRGWESMRILAIDNDHPEEACRPFAADRKGLVLGEGAAIFILESMVSAKRRGVSVLGEIAGFGATADAGHLTDPSSDGAARAMRMAMRDGGLDPSDIDYINAHGTATKANDVTETRAIREALGREADRIAVSSTKSMHGHAMGATGAIELAASLLALNDGFIPPTLNLRSPDPECDLDFVPLEARRAEARAFLTNSFGFGGLNACLAVRTLLTRP